MDTRASGVVRGGDICAATAVLPMRTTPGLFDVAQGCDAARFESPSHTTAYRERVQKLSRPQLGHGSDMRANRTVLMDISLQLR
jgi:hypothetical protein